MNLIRLKNAEEFQSYIDASLATGTLRGNNLKNLCSLVWNNSAKYPWLNDFQWLLFMPRFLNIAVVAGSCNSNCRMCSAGKGQPFTYLTTDKMRTILENAPTTDGITFSAGSSEPLMNPDFLEILAETSRRRIGIDFFTNGLALTPKLTDKIVDAQTVGMINFSLDAASPETYERIRRRDLRKVKSNIQRLVERKALQKKRLPSISISMVEMEDNIEELPTLVDYARSIGAFRVYVEALINPDGENRSATRNPRWPEAVTKAQAMAQSAGIFLQLPVKLQLTSLYRSSTENLKCPANVKTGAADRGASDPGSSWRGFPTDRSYSCCSWLFGVWIEIDGKMSPCCVNPHVNLGNIFNGKLSENKFYLLAKMKLLTGRVFPSCLNLAHSCAYLSEAAQAGDDINQLVLERTEPDWIR